MKLNTTDLYKTSLGRVTLKGPKVEKKKCWVSTNPTNPILAQSWIVIVHFFSHCGPETFKQC